MRTGKRVRMDFDAVEAVKVMVETRYDGA